MGDHANWQAIARLNNLAPRNSKFREHIDDIRRKAVKIDRQVLVVGDVPASAIKTPLSMGLTCGLQVVLGAEIINSDYEIRNAVTQSYAEHTVVPLAKESVRQMGGWTGAWAGAEICGLAGVAVGIETGPGAIVTGVVGGF